MTVRSPFYEGFAAFGARFVTVSGVEVPEAFGPDPAEEVLAAFRTAGFGDVSEVGRIRVTGADRARFLDRILSQDIKSLTPGRGTRALLCNRRGRIDADIRVLNEGASLLLLCEGGTVQRALSVFEMLHFTEDITLTDVSFDLCGLTLQGGRARDALSALLGQPAPDLAPLGFFQVELPGGHPLTVLRRDRSELQGYDLMLPPAGAGLLWQLLGRASSALPLSPLGRRALAIMRIEAGQTEYGQELSDGVIPQHARLEDEAVSFTKGCYLGQEVVAKMKYLAKVPRLLSPLLVEGAVPEVGADVVAEDGKKVGKVVSAVPSARLERPIAMAYLKREQAHPGQRLQVGADPATVLDFPPIESGRTLLEA